MAFTFVVRNGKAVTSTGLKWPVHVDSGSADGQSEALNVWLKLPAIHASTKFTWITQYEVSFHPSRISEIGHTFAARGRGKDLYWMRPT